MAGTADGPASGGLSCFAASFPRRQRRCPPAEAACRDRHPTRQGPLQGRQDPWSRGSADTTSVPCTRPRWQVLSLLAPVESPRHRPPRGIFLPSEAGPVPRCARCRPGTGIPAPSVSPASAAWSRDRAEAAPIPPARLWPGHRPRRMPATNASGGGCASRPGPSWGPAEYGNARPGTSRGGTGRTHPKTPVQILARPGGACLTLGQRENVHESPSISRCWHVQ
ncbi:hypothetical protein J2T21_003904 [Paeniglutamicibacter psychrophenolicus]|nr:hypothetical protein [Paeniglutamicibacter psychrophenolicus]